MNKPQNHDIHRTKPTTHDTHGPDWGSQETPGISPGLQRIIVCAGAAAFAAGVAHNHLSDDEPATPEAPPTTVTVESGDTVHGLIEETCGDDMSQSELREKAHEVGLENNAANPSSPDVSAGDTITIRC